MHQEVTAVSPDTGRSRVSARIGGIAESATLAVDAKAKALKAAGRPVIGFGAGEPDFPTPEAIVAAAQEACADPRNHRYTPAGGLPELKAAIVEKTKRDSGYAIAENQVLVTNGGKQAVYQAFATLLDPGDEVILHAEHRLPVELDQGGSARGRRGGGTCAPRTPPSSGTSAGCPGLTCSRWCGAGPRCGSETKSQKVSWALCAGRISRSGCGLPAWMTSGNLMPSWMKKTGMLLPTRSNVPSKVSLRSHGCRGRAPAICASRARSRT